MPILKGTPRAAVPPRRATRAAPGEAILAPLDMLRPTQAAVGMRAVAAKREKLERRTRKKAKMLRFLEKRPIPAVMGPGDQLYIVDHHHLTLALLQSEIEAAFVRVLGDFSDLPRRQFWRSMAELGLLYPFDERGCRIRPESLPPSIRGLRCDPFRDLAWSVREEGGFEKTSEPYAEFRWAEYFRDRIPAGLLRRDFGQAHELAMRLSREGRARRLPGYAGR